MQLWSTAQLPFLQSNSIYKSIHNTTPSLPLATRVRPRYCIIMLMPCRPYHVRNRTANMAACWNRNAAKGAPGEWQCQLLLERSMVLVLFLLLQWL